MRNRYREIAGLMTLGNLPTPVGGSMSISGGPSSPTPITIPATNNTTGYSFTANWTAGGNNTGNYFLDVFLEDGMTYVPGFNNFIVEGATSKLVSPVGGLHLYKYQARAALDIIIRPYIRTDADYQHIVTVVYIDGHSNEIANTIALITDSSATNRYKVIVPNGIYYSGRIDLTEGTFIDVIGESKAGVIIYGNDPAQTVFELGGGNVMLKDFTAIQTNAGKGCIHSDNHIGATVQIVLNVDMFSTGDAIWAFSGGLHSDQRMYCIDSYIFTQDGLAAFYHNRVESESGGTISCSLVMIDTVIESGNPLTNFALGWDNRNSGSLTDFVYVTGGNVPSFHEIAATGIGETGIYIDPSANCTHKVFDDPASELTLEQFTTLIVDNNLSYSHNSNVTEVTTISEGNKAFDNLSAGIIVFAASVKDQLRTAYSGPFVSSTTPDAAVTTFYDQSLNGRNATKNTVAPIFKATGMGLGKPALLFDISLSPVMSIATQYHTSKYMDFILVLKDVGFVNAFMDTITTGMFYHVNGTLFTSLRNPSGNASVSYSLDSANHIINIRRRGTALVDFLVDGVSVGTDSFDDNTQSYYWQDLLKNIDAYVAAISCLDGPYEYPDSEVDAVVTKLKTDWGIL